LAGGLAKRPARIDDRFMLNMFFVKNKQRELQSCSIEKTIVPDTCFKMLFVTILSE
jgi:hypothetical protein